MPGGALKRAVVLVALASPSAPSAATPSERLEQTLDLAVTLDAGSTSTEQEKPLVEGYFDWIVEQRNSWSSEVVELGTYVDGFLGGEEATLQSNDSFVKLGMFGRWSEGGMFEMDPRFKFRLDLPRTQERYRLVIENDSPESLSPEERNRENAATTVGAPETSSSGFLRVLSAFNDWSLKGDIGIRFSSPISPFVRGRATRTVPLASDWSLRLESLPFYFITDGFGFIQAFYFDYLLSDRALMRFKTEAQWKEENRFWEFAEVWSYSCKLDESAVLSYSLGWGGRNKPELRTTSYYTNVTYRYRLYKDWLFAEVTPEIVWARDSGYQDEPSITFGVEMIFAK